MGPRFWRISVFDSTSQLWETRIAVGRITDAQLQNLLRALVSKHGLTEDEIVACHLRRRSIGRMELLDVRKAHHPHQTWTCGENPHAIADLVDKDGCPIPTPTLR